MHFESDTGPYEVEETIDETIHIVEEERTPNLRELDAELERRIETALERKLLDPAFLTRLLERVRVHMHIQTGRSG